eukprot:m.101073 g.101073  ORF g.101073 m.101073 type:complete len:100 (-) comp22267_c0_seq2:878-1177(-)
MILNILEGYNFSPATRSAVTTHQTIEAFKFAYALRTRLADACCEDPGDGFCSNTTSCESITHYASEMLSKINATEWRSKIWDNRYLRTGTVSFLIARSF